MTLRTRLIAIKALKTGDAIGYGGAWVCRRATRMGVASIGYGDGYPRHARCGTPVLVRDKRVPLIGRVSMDMITVDLTECPEAEVGDMVTLWGIGLPVEEIARHADTIPYVLLCNVTPRVKRMEHCVVLLPASMPFFELRNFDIRIHTQFRCYGPHSHLLDSIDVLTAVRSRTLQD